jgi:hypothetical protein
MIEPLTEAANAVEDFFRTLDLKKLAEFGTAVTAVGTALILVRNRALLTASAMTLLTSGLKGFALIAAVFLGQQALQLTGAFNSLATTTTTAAKSQNKLTTSTNRYIQSVGQSNIVLAQNLDLQKEIDALMADTILQVMANNDVSDKRIKAAQMILQAEANLTEAMKGRIIINREAAVMGNLQISTVQDATEEESKYFLVLQRNLQEKLKAIHTDKELIDINADLTRGFNILSGSVRSFNSAQGDTAAQARIVIQTLGSLLALLPGGQAVGAVVGMASQFVAHSGGLIKNNGVQRFATGGVVQGQDNVPIMAQAGEFVMQRSAVQNIGVQNLAQMNKTGRASGGLTINIAGDIIGDEDHVRTKVLPFIKDELRREANA